MIKLIKTQKELDGKIDLPVFAKASYLKCKGKRIGWFESDQYIIPFVLQKKLIFTWLTFTYTPIAKSHELSHSDEQSFLQEVIEYVKDNSICDFINKAQAYVLFKSVPDCCEIVEYGTYKMNIDKTDDEILSGCHHKHRYKIRKAGREGVVIKQSKDVDLIYENIKNTMVRQNSIFYPSYEYLSKLKKLLPDNVKFFIAEKDDQLQGTAVLIFDRNAGYYMYGGSIPKPATGAINLLHFEAIKFLREREIYTYDFVGARINAVKGSKYDGIQRFKKGFGAEMERGYTFRYIVKPFKYFLFTMLIRFYGEITGKRYNDVIDQIKNEDRIARETQVKPA